MSIADKLPYVNKGPQIWIVLSSSRLTATKTRFSIIEVARISRLILETPTYCPGMNEGKQTVGPVIATILSLLNSSFWLINPSTGTACETRSPSPHSKTAESKHLIFFGSRDLKRVGGGPEDKQRLFKTLKKTRARWSLHNVDCIIPKCFPSVCKAIDILKSLTTIQNINKKCWRMQD